MYLNGKNFFPAAVRVLLKLMITAAVFAVLYFSSKGAVFSGTEFTAFDYHLLLPAAIPLILVNIVAALRWRALAQMIKIDLGRFEAFSLTMQGLFFSLVIPGGAIGGDVIKIAALKKHIKPGTGTEGAFSILIDRIIGMFALFLPVMILLFFSYDIFVSLHIPGIPEKSGGVTVWWLLAIICLAGIFAGLAIFIHRRLSKIPGIDRILELLDRKSSGRITRLTAAADCYAGNPRKLALWTVISIVGVHLLPVISMKIIFYSIGITVPLLPLCTAVLAGNTAGLIPLFPGGFGGRDLVTVALLTAAGVPVKDAGTAQLFTTGLLFCINLIGSIFFIFDRKNRRCCHE